VADGCGCSPHRTGLGLFSLIIPEITGIFQKLSLAVLSFWRNTRYSGSWNLPRSRIGTGEYQAGISPDGADITFGHAAALGATVFRVEILSDQAFSSE